MDWNELEMKSNISATAASRVTIPSPFRVLLSFAGFYMWRHVESYIHIYVYKFRIAHRYRHNNVHRMRNYWWVESMFR